MSITTTIEIKKTGASWRRWTGKHHLVQDGATETVCGRPVPEDSTTTQYPSHHCYRCEAKAPDDLLDAAEAARKAIADQIDGHHEKVLDANRKGRFVVYRCRLCGSQHAGQGRGPGQAYCMNPSGHHVAQLEQIDVQGPAWEEQSS